MSYSGKFKDKNNNLHPVTSVLYGTCDTAAATAAKVVTCADFDTLMTGVTIRVKFDNANTAASPTVNINSTGAKSVYRFGSTAPVDGDSWKAGEVVELLYDGTSFFMVSADDIGSKQDTLTFDDTPTDGSNNPVKSNGIYDALATKANTDMVAADFNAGTSYTAGNYCIYEGKFYKFKNNHSGAWSAADVDEIKITGELSALKSGLTTLDNEVNGDATTYPYADVITIPDAVLYNLADCKVKIEPVQSGSGDPSPTNVRPITGHTEASVQRDGKNLFDENDVEIGTAWNGNANADRARIIIPCKPNTTYTFSMNGTNNIDFTVYGWFKSTPTLTGNVSFPQTFTTESDSEYIVFGFNKTSISKSDIEFMKLQLELGSTATPYEPYACKTYTIALGDTIYGGTVDFKTGVMTVDRAVVDMSSLSWTELRSANNKKLYSTTISDRKYGQTISILCEKYNYGGLVGSQPDIDVKDFGVYAYYLSGQTNNTVYCITTDTDVIDGNMVYELATPTAIQLTPQQILLKGQNTLTASTGQISVTTVNGVSGAIGAVQTQANATDAELAELAADIAEQLPTAPTTDGAYVLTVTVADGTPTYSWESAS